MTKIGGVQNRPTTVKIPDVCGHDWRCPLDAATVPAGFVKDECKVCSWRWSVKEPQ